MPQHFLLSSKARTLSLSKVMRMTDAEAREAFKALRWQDGKPFCSRCGSVELYDCKAEKLAPGGFHLMLFALAKPLKAGDKASFTLCFKDKAGNITHQTVTLPIKVAQ